MSDFAGTEHDFAAGSLKGLRSWVMDAKGRLRGVTHDDIWLPGENVARCRATKSVPCPSLAEKKTLADDAVEAKPKKKGKKKAQTSGTSYSISFTMTDPWTQRNVAHCSDKTCYGGVHRVPSGHDFDFGCQCGFWAYDEAGFQNHGRIVGLIEGFGRTTVGTKGFRSEKARIVALAKHADGTSELTMSEQVRLAQLYPTVEFFENVEEMVTAHPEALRTWPDVDEAFWQQPDYTKESGAYSFGGLMMPSSYLWSTPSSTSFLKYTGGVA